MHETFISYFKKLLIFTLILGIPGYISYFFLPEEVHTPMFPYIYGFFFVTTLCVHFFLMKFAGGSPAMFAKWFMLASFLKLFLYVAVMFLYALSFKNDAKSFIIPYFILYVFYTSFEVITMSVRNTRKLK